MRNVAFAAVGFAVGMIAIEGTAYTVKLRKAFRQSQHKIISMM